MEASSSRTVVFRADAAPWIGAGHVARCLSLAETFGAEGWRCRLACRAETPETAPAIARCFRETLILEGVEADEPRAMAERWPEGCDLLVVDHYEHAAVFERATQPWARAILAIDDLCRAHTCDYLLDPTPGRTAGDYAGRVPQGCEVFLGPAFAPLKAVFAERRARVLASRRKPGRVERILVGLGATDPDNLTAFALGGIVRSDLKAAVEIVLGPAAPHREEIRAHAAALDLEVTVHEELEDLADPMSRADLAIGAAGITSWERCTLGLPTLLIITADNQESAAAALCAARAARRIGERGRLSVGALADTLRHLSTDKEQLRAMAQAAAGLCDGLGSARLVAAIDPPRARDGVPVRLRPATTDDESIMFEWQSGPGARRHSRDPRPPRPETHREWLARRLVDTDCILSVIVHGREPVGVLRLDRLVSEGAFEVSILVTPAFQRLGIGKAALILARRLMPRAEYRAEALPDNTASHALFSAAGYSRRGEWYVSLPRTEPAAPMRSAG